MNNNKCPFVVFSGSTGRCVHQHHRPGWPAGGAAVMLLSLLCLFSGLVLGPCGEGAITVVWRTLLSPLSCLPWRQIEGLIGWCGAIRLVTHSLASIFVLPKKGFRSSLVKQDSWLNDVLHYSNNKTTITYCIFEGWNELMRMRITNYLLETC